MLNYLKKVGCAIDKSVGYTCIIFAVAMTLSTLTGIFLRYLMSEPLNWTEEFARYTMIWMGLLAISMGVKRKSHLGVNFFYLLFPKSLQTILRYVVNFLTLSFFVVMIIYGYRMALDGYYQISPALKMRMFYILIVVPITSIISIYHLLIHILSDIFEK